jgi:hypothetical protein
MTPQQIADQKAFHRAELERLDALEKAQRPALATGQVWRGGKTMKGGATYLATVFPEGMTLVNLDDGCRYSSYRGFDGDDDSFVFVGLARDVLRVVQPDAVEQVALPPLNPFPMPTGYEEISSLQAGEGDEYSNDGLVWWTSGGGQTHPKIPAMFHWRRKVAPVQAEPTGADLVGEKCWVRNDGAKVWAGPWTVTAFEHGDGLRYYFEAGFSWWGEAKLYREGVTP